MIKPKKKPPAKQVVVKKVSAYPIKAEITFNETSCECKILKIEKVGFFANMLENIVKPQDICEVSFTLPVLKHELSVQAKVIKIYDQYQDKLDKLMVERLAEMHFEELSRIQRSQINQFLLQLGQK